MKSIWRLLIGGVPTDRSWLSRILRSNVLISVVVPSVSSRADIFLANSPRLLLSSKAFELLCGISISDTCVYPGISSRNFSR